MCIGFVDKDNIGIAGMEKYLDEPGPHRSPRRRASAVDPENLKPVRLSLDLKATHALRDELVEGLREFKAKAAAGAILDVNTGEIIALESLPDFDPNDPGRRAQDPDATSTASTSASTRWARPSRRLSIAMALDAGKVTLDSHIDARDSLRYGHFTIHDFDATHRVLSVPEVFTHSSNIGAARMALMVGVDGHQAFLRKMGQLDRLRTELPESAEPLVPKHWGELNTMTIAFGQGLNVAPLQAMMAVARAGQRRQSDEADLPGAARRRRWRRAAGVVSAQTSESMRYLMRSNADARLGALRQHSRLFRRRQDRHGRQDRSRPLRPRQGLHDLHGHHAGRQAEVSLSRDVR